MTMTAEHKHTNRLIDATSPYLLQHAHNPVDWYEWGPEALEKAKNEDKPIFLSIGYSACHWCHVMERESFENEAIARIMNESFVCIKVDREERPDVDDIYMAAVQITNNGQGGWPMSVFLEPKTLKPFVGGTYFPPDDRYGRPGFPTLLQRVAGYWTNRREEVLQQADAVAAQVDQMLSARSRPRPLGPQDVQACLTQLLAIYDAENGGFAGAPARAPKFPIPATLDMLIHAGWDDPQVRPAIR